MSQAVAHVLLVAAANQYRFGVRAALDAVQRNDGAEFDRYVKQIEAAMATINRLLGGRT